MISRRFVARVFLAGLFFAVIRTGYSQEKKEEPPHWKGDVSLGLSLARGNTRSSNLSFTFSAGGPVGKNLKWENRGMYLFGEVDDKTAAESGEIASRLDWNHTKRLFSYYEFQALHDRFKNYSYRFLPAAGAGYKFVDQKAVSLVLTAGLCEVLTRYYDTGATASYTGLKGGEAFVWKISETAEFNERAELIADVSDLGRSYLRLEANLVTAIVGSWSVKLAFIDSYDSRPVGVGIRKNDIVLIAGIARKF